MKKEIDGLLAVLHGIHLDIAAYSPKHASGLDLSYRQVKTILETRGTEFLTISMPELGKLVDKGLSSGHIDMPSVYRILGRTKRTLPKRWCRVFLMVFTEGGVLQSRLDPNWVFFLRQLCYYAKKLKKECSDEAVDQSIEDFLRVETELHRPYFGWGSSDFDRVGFNKRPSLLDVNPGGPGELPLSDRGHPKVAAKLVDCMQKACDWLATTMGEIDPHSVVPKHGSGSVADMPTGMDKYSFPSWPSLLDSVFHKEVHSVVNLGVDTDIVTAQDVIVPAKLIAVPKTLKGPRLIASEPACNQYIQQGILKWIRENLPKPVLGSINPRSQEPNRELALSASRSGSHATIDLRSASDYLSCWLVERVFRKNMPFLRALNASRSNFISWKKKSGDKGVIKLLKFSHQGSAVTFPVQSIVYYLAALAVRMHEAHGGFDHRRVAALSREIRVFGDDIIVPTEDVVLLGYLLSLLGMKINMTKTHYSGSFRESCGMDAYAGCEVTPAYLSYTSCDPTHPETIVSTVEVSNNFYRRGLWNAAQSVEALLPKWVQDLLPASRHALGCISLFTHQDSSFNLLKEGRFPKRGEFTYDSDLHQCVYRGLTVKVKTRQDQRDSMQSLLQWFVESPEPDTDWSSGYQTAKPSLKLRKGWVPI